MRVRSIRNCVELIRKEDPNSEITENFIRKGIKNGFIPCVFVGVKALVDVDNLLRLVGGQNG